jgi:spore germination protein GerM
VRVVTGLIVGALVLAGCGVPTQSKPVTLEPGVVPSQLQRTDRTPATTPSATAGRPTVEVEFVQHDKLVSRHRVAPTAAPDDVLETVVQALMSGPSKAEQANGLTTALPPGLTLTVSEVRGKRVVLELSGETEGRSATENVLAVGQIVLSMTALPSIDEVTLSRGGVPVEALLADGALTTDPLTAADYASLRPS